MKITYGKNVEFSFKFLLWFAVLFVLFTDSLFLELIFGELKNGKVAPIYPEKLLMPFSVLVALLFYNRFSKFMKRVFWLAMIYLVVLVVESSLNYNSYFVYPHVFSKLLVLFPAFFMYLFPLNNEEKDFKRIVMLICAAFLINLVLYKSYILSAASFIDTQRGFPASSAYLLLLPCLFFFNKYLQRNTFFYLFAFLGTAAFIIFLQHRSVWIATSIALFLNFLLVKKATFKPAFQSYVSLFAIPFFLGFLVFTFVLSADPDLLSKLADRADDIFNYKDEGTGSWRYEQFLSYWPFIEENPILGMHFEGFELPIQFYHPEAGTPFFNDGTGHHFHSLYLDKLFYLGFIGLLLTFLPVFYIVYKLFKKRTLSVVQLTLGCFIISAVFYGLSYWWPPYVYALMGMAVLVLEEKEEEEDLDEEEDDKMIDNKYKVRNYKNEYV